MGDLKKIKKWLEINENKLVWASSAAYTLIFSAICLWKYAIFAYNGIDLAYFSQVFWNSLHGYFFQQTIHPHLSLGDHAELVIPALLPFYALFADPRTLLVLQTLALALGAIPLHALARRRLGSDAIASLFIVAAYLASPLIQNINLFEFHILPFALVPLFYALLAYEKKKLPSCLAFAALALLVREDVALVVAGIGLLAAAEKRSWHWRLWPPALAVVYFVTAVRLIGHFAPAGDYKFAIYYSWIIDSLDRPLDILRHFTTIPNLEMILGFGLPLLFLPYLRPRKLLLSLGPLVQILLGAPGGGAIILETHYATLFIPGLFAAAVDGLAAAPDFIKKISPVLIARSPTRKHFLYGILAIAMLYGMLALGPLPAVTSRLLLSEGDRIRANAANRVLQEISPREPVAAGYALLPALSSREKLYSLHYGYLGVLQFDAAPYAIPDEAKKIVIDLEDFADYRAQFSKTAWAVPHAAGGAGRIAAMARGKIAASDTFAIYVRYDAAREQPSDTALTYQVGNTPLAISQRYDAARQHLDLTLSWRAETIHSDTVARLLLIKNDDEILRRELALNDIGVLIGGQKNTLLLSIPVARLPTGAYGMRAELLTQTAMMTVSGIRSIERLQTSQEILGAITLPTFLKE